MKKLVIKVSRKVPFKQGKGVILGQVIESWFRFDKSHSMLGSYTSSTLRSIHR